MDQIRSELFKLTTNDFVKGAATAVISGSAFAVYSVIYPIVSAPDANIFTVDWGVLLSHALIIGINAGVAAFVGYIGKNFFSNEQGQVVTPFGNIG